MYPISCAYDVFLIYIYISHHTHTHIHTQTHIHTHTHTHARAHALIPHLLHPDPPLSPPSPHRIISAGVVAMLMHPTLLPKEGQLPIDEVAADISKKLDDESVRTAVVASGEYAAVRQEDESQA
jgi:hypothetical protein